MLKAWEAQPHPELAAAFAAIAPEETASERQKRFEPLLKLRPEVEETRLLRAELAIAAEDFPAARRALGDLVEAHPTARALTLMAAIERGEGADDAVVRGWLARALGASRGPQWVCDHCHNIQAEWGPVCDNCAGFDTLSWREPVGGGVPHCEWCRNAAADRRRRRAPVPEVLEPFPEAAPHRRRPAMPRSWPKGCGATRWPSPMRSALARGMSPEK